VVKRSNWRPPSGRGPVPGPAVPKTTGWSSSRHLVVSSGRLAWVLTDAISYIACPSPSALRC
jgi:hypothetical protein